MSRAGTRRTRPVPRSQAPTLTRFTHEQILALTGKTLDTAIAYQVMGWTTWCSPCVPRGSTTPDCWATGSQRNPTYRISGWRPSRDPNDMASMVERMNRAGFRLQVSQTETLEWRALFHGRRQIDHWALGPTMPCAVARAALLAGLTDHVSKSHSTPQA